MISPEQLKQSEEHIQSLKRALEMSLSVDDKAALTKQLADAEDQHRALHQAYISEMQRAYMESFIKRIR